MQLHHFPFPFFPSTPPMYPFALSQIHDVVMPTHTHVHMYVFLSMELQPAQSAQSCLHGCDLRGLTAWYWVSNWRVLPQIRLFPLSLYFLVGEIQLLMARIT